MAMLMVVFSLVVRKGLTCFAAWSYVILFLSTLPSLVSVVVIPVLSLSLSYSGFLELFEENKLVNKVRDSVQSLQYISLTALFFYSHSFSIYMVQLS
jgi:hypothetical protein